MRLLLTVLIIFPTLAHASVGDDINALLDRFFGGDQAPIEEVPTPEPKPLAPNLEEPPAVEINVEALEVRREIMTREAELAAFETQLRQLENQTADLRSHILSQQQQLEIVDQQIELNGRKLNFYRSQYTQWQSLVENLTREKSVLRAEMRILEREYDDLLSKNFIQKQNFQLNPTVSWWQWLLSDKPVSQLLSERKQVSVEQSQKSNELKRLDTLKVAYDAQELEAVQALGTVGRLKDQLAKEQIVLGDLAAGRANLLATLEVDSNREQERLEEARSSQAEITTYLQSLRAQLQEIPSPSAQAPVTTLAWPLVNIALTAGFKDEAYAKHFGREHLGIDLRASQGTDVLAAAEGMVSKVATDATGYTYIIVQHTADLYTVYGHLSKTLVEVNDAVDSGQAIAWSGGTPGTAGAGYFTSGPHLHFEVFSGGQFVDPLSLLPPQ